ncbi:MAG: MiaB/RimO family radical SAM methylthiotransferase [Candidatus Longimicrobiales bacterium M2_2A_002]
MTRSAMDSPRSGTQNRRTAYVETYGCQMNISDGELMEGILSSHGYGMVDSPEQADVILVNTCAIREHAEQRVLGRVGELNRLKKDNPELVIGVTGCMAQRLGEKLLHRASYVDLVMGPDGYRKLPEALAAIRPGEPVVRATTDRTAAGQQTVAGPAKRRAELPVLPQGAVEAAASPGGQQRLAVLELEPHENYEGLEVRRTGEIGAWVPVQRGCNYRCTYCIVPYVRGSEKNRAPEQVLDEVRGIAEQGVPEVTLLGQTVNSYVHGDWSFPRLLRAVARVDGIRRVRFTSPHPNDVTPELIRVMAEEPAVCRQLHLPVQSGADRVLKRMVRRYTVERFLEIVDELRTAIPDLALSTDVIVAFPGETEEEYEATLDLMRTVRFDDAFLYRYSPREGTPATRLPEEDFLPDAVGQARLERLIEVQRSIQAEINRDEVGRVEEVLVEKSARSAGDMLGRTERNKVVAFPGAASLVGRFVQVRLDDTTGATFIGRRVEGEARVA